MTRIRHLLACLSLAFVCVPVSSRSSTDIAANQVRRVMGEATADPVASGYLGSVSTGKGNVGYTENSTQWRNLVFFELTPSQVLEVQSAYKVELTMDPSWVASQPNAPHWRIDYLGVVDQKTDTSQFWNEPFYDWQVTPGQAAGTLEMDGILVSQTFDVTSLFGSFSVSSYPAFLLFRVSSLGPPSIGEAFDGGLSATLSRHSLRIYGPDSEPELVISSDRLTVPEGGGATVSISLKGQPSEPVRVNLDLMVDDWLGVDPASLLFTPADWHIPQQVTLTGNGDVGFAYKSETIRCEVDAIERPTPWAGMFAEIHVARTDNDPLNLRSLDGIESLTAVLEMETEEASGTVVSAAHMSPVWTHNGTIYHVYVNHLQQAVVARLPPGGPRTTHILKEGVVEDAHHSFSLGIDPGGYIHVSGDMHNGNNSDRWNYWVSQSPEDIFSWSYYAPNQWDNWPDAIDSSLPGPILSGNMPTYVVFRPDNAGRLYLSYRGRARDDFTKGWTGLRMDYLDGSGSRRWESLGAFTKPSYDDSFFPARVIAWDEIGGRLGNGDWYQTYRGQFWFDAANRLHLCWAYYGVNSQPPGEGSSDIGSGATHILYACSPDGGNSWERADGTPITLPLSPLNADVVVEANPGNLTSTCYVTVNADGHPVVAYSRGGTPMHGDPYLKLWSPEDGWSAALPLPTADAFQIVADRRGILTLPDDTGTWFRSYDGGYSWKPLSGAPFYSNGSNAGIDYAHLQETGNIRFHTMAGSGLRRFQVWTVSFNPESTPTHAESWREEWFNFQGDSGLGADTADPDFDNRMNWMERAFGSNPLQADVPPGFSLEVVTLDGTQRIQYAYPRISGGVDESNGNYRFAGLRYMLEVSTDMENWGTRDDWIPGEIQSGSNPETEMQSVISPVDLAPGHQSFYRLKLEYPAP